MILPATQAALLLFQGGLQMEQLYNKGALSQTALDTIIHTLAGEIPQTVADWNAAGTTAAAIKADGQPVAPVAVP
jgi:hypothetical protein